MAKAKEADADEKEQPAAKPRFETLRAVFWAAVIALAIRSFVVEPFKIPSGSMIPTLLVGDYVLVNKFAYGVRLPFTGTLLVPVGKPKRGDVMVFRYPDDPSQDFIKRLIGMPGDKIEIKDRRLYINDKLVERDSQGEYLYPSGDLSEPRSAERFLEHNPEGVEYTVLQFEPENLQGHGAEPTGPWIVPEGQYFMMGDNRDNSADSRRWRHTFVTPEAIKGKAFMIHWSWVIAPNDRAQRSFIGDLLFTLWRVVTFQVEEIRWGRIGHRVSGPAD
ncbi:MAG TPA: signal peptidase I [Myxococcota bacterium]|nr:signal peptidase I [Myxococcota bacterium]